MATGCVAPLVALLGDELETVCSQALAALMYITVANSGKNALLDAGGLPPLLALLEVDDEKVLVNVLQVRASQPSRRGSSSAGWGRVAERATPTGRGVWSLNVLRALKIQ